MENLKNGRSISLTVKATELGVRSSLDEICKHLRRFAAKPDEIDTAELVFAEAMNNVVEHALVAISKAEFSVDVTCQQNFLACRIKDSGCPLPGLSIPLGQKVALETSLDDLPEGGFGWMLIRNLTQRLTYSRQDGENCLEFALPMKMKP